MERIKVELLDLMYRLDEIRKYLENDRDRWEQFRITKNAVLEIYDLLDRYNNNPYININIQNINQLIQGFTGIVNELEHDLNLNKRMQ